MDSTSINAKCRDSLEPIDLTSESVPTTPDEAISQMPVAFTELQEAKSYFEFLSKEFLHWIAYQLAWASKQRNEAEARSENTNMTTLLANQRGIFLHGFKTWRRSFLPLLSECMADNTSNRTKAAAMTLDLRYKSFNSSLSVNHFLGEMGYDQITDKFREVISISQQIIKFEIEMQAPTYAVEGVIIPSVYAVALKCRDRIVRRQAIAILESRLKREGVFDSCLQAKLARLQMDIEESGVPPGEVIPEENRIRGIKSTHDIMKRAGSMKYLKLNPQTRMFTQEVVEFRW